MGCGGADAKGGRNNGGNTSGSGAMGGTGGNGGTGIAGDLGGAAIGAGVGGFSGSGNGGGPPVLDPTAEPFTKDDTGASGLAADVIDMLKTGGGSCTINPTFPYEGTMFPGGLQPPLIMWPGAAEASYVRFGYEGADIVDYQFASGPTENGQLQIPREAWNEITRRTNQGTLNVTLTIKAGGALSTCTLHWRIAAGNMVGALYYNTYQAPEPGIPGVGAIVRLTLGSEAEIYKQAVGAPPIGPCYSCHSVSFNGKVLVASMHTYTPFAQEFLVDKFDVSDAVDPAPSGQLHNANFGALTPDGSRILAMGNPECTTGSDTFPRRPNNFPLVEGNDVARVMDTSNGMVIPSPGLDAANFMWMAQFSPSGDKVVFNHAKLGGDGKTDRTQLAMMDYDYDTNTFSNLQVIVNAPEFAPGHPAFDYAPGPAGAFFQPHGVNMCADPAPEDPASGLGTVPMGSCDGPCYPAWPFFTPDGKGVVFSLTSDPDFASAFPGRDTPSKSDLWYVDTETREVVRLDNVNRGLQEIDQINNYYPTVLPIAVGGYFWMFWTAVRDYGHLVAGRDPNAVPNSVIDAEKKRIWVAAIKPKFVGTEENPVVAPLTDPSFPGFYADGQSLSGNVRAFAALNPCLDNGASCAAGIDCCCGYCTVDAATGSGTCSCEPPMCSKTNEKCETSEDCCPPVGDEPRNICLGGFCNFIVVQ